MTGRERILAALGCQEEPDRVPVFELGINEASIVKLGRRYTDRLPPVMHVCDMTAAEQIQYLDLLALVLTELGNDGVSTIFIIGKERIDADHARDRYGTTYLLSEHGEPLPIAGPIGGPDDLEAARAFKPDPGDFLMLAYMIRKMGHDVAHFFSIPGPFRFSWQLRGGMEKLLLDYMRQPDFALELARITTDFCLEAIGTAADAGADAIALEGDLAFNTSTLMSPDQYRTFLRPFHQEIVDTAHDRGLKIIKHSDGNLWPILDDLVDIGFDGIHPFQPQSMDIRKAKRLMQGRCAVIGNIDCTHLLPYGTPEEVDRAVYETIRDVAPGGGYIISSSNTIHPDVDPANYVALVEAAKRYGRYPIALDQPKGDES